MKKRIFAVFTAFLMIVTLIPFGTSFAENAAKDATLKLHYNREDGSYDDWDVWAWNTGANDGAFAFADEDGEMVATIPIGAAANSVGFIIRKGGDGWESKDVDADQFIDVSDLISGTLHAYVESGVEGYTAQYSDDAVRGTKLVSAKYNGDSTITATFSGKIEDPESLLKVTDADGDIEIASIDAVSDTVYTVTLASELDFSKTYSFICDGVVYPLTMPDYFALPSFEEEFTYTGDDLGATYTKEKTTFRVWAPTADAVKVNIYTSGTSTASDLEEQIELTADVNGTWVGSKDGDLNGKYYTYSVTLGTTVNEAADPYARSAGLNGVRSMIIDLDATDPEGWENDKDPNEELNFNDAIIYELHIRDLSTNSNSGITNKGKFLGLTETGTTTPSGIPTGLDHIKDLGITHLHILPMYDFGSVDESNPDAYNWGYDPVNYNVPEGSYSTDPANGEVRVKEMKQMVQALHNNGISVVMDVVYNHVYSASDFCFNKIVPTYFSRPDSNGSGCGNDTATERAMVHKYIVDSVNYWADEYHIDGFRFDLVGLMDTDLINDIVETVHKDHPNVVFYGEGWTLTTNVTKSGYSLATQTNSTLTPGFAYFSDTIRDGLKGNVFDDVAKGYVSGASGLTDTIIKSFMGFAPTWCKTPAQSINYASCHDNMTLIDRITNSTPDATREEQIKMNNLAAAIYLTAQGIPFMQAGEEMLRTKPNGDGTYNGNTYNAGDEINQLRWENLDDEEYMNVYEYYKGLIAFRKTHPALRLTNADDVNANVTSVSGLPTNVAAFNIKGGEEVNGEESDAIFVIFNPNAEEAEVTLPDGTWNVCIDGEKAGTESLRTASGTVTVAGISAMVLTLGKNPQAPSSSNSSAANNGSPFPIVPIIVVCALIVVAAVIIIIVVVSKKKKNS